MNYSNSKISTSTHIELYTGMLIPRMIEEKMLILLRQGKISKWFSGIGQEAISVGVTKALNNDEYILPMHRNLGVFTSREIPLYRLHLPTYNGIKYLAIGHDTRYPLIQPKQKKLIENHNNNKKPIVWYGTSILQGAVASRPGMIFTN